MERLLTPWERDVLAALLSIEGPPGGPDAASMRESVPHLVVTEECECGCPSFFVRDPRQETTRDGGSFHFSNGVSRDGQVGLFLLVRNDRPWSVDVTLPPGMAPSSSDARPAAGNLTVTSPYDR